MADIAFLGIALAFFGLAYLYVLACDRIVGHDTARGASADPDRSEASAEATDAVVAS